ncbi:MAG: hypothetical protein IJ555_08340 [Ruminococcus sp.]|nr:hypothetical protein [Ruminococcus sp.]
MDNAPYGQADYYYAISRQMLAVLCDKGLITSEQRDRIDDLNRRTIFARYPSIADLEVSV